MDTPEIRAALDRHWEFTGVDIDRSHEIYHDDVIVEFPQSGERISGKYNIYELSKHSPVEMQVLIGVCHRANIHLTNVQKHLNYLRRNYRVIVLYKGMKRLLY